LMDREKIVNKRWNN
jgi:hypothetical protein